MINLDRLKKSYTKLITRHLLPEPSAKFFLSLFHDYCRAGVFDSNTEKMIEGVFDLSETTVADAMTPRCNTDLLEHDNSWEEIYETIGKSKHSRYPVLNSERDEIVGTLITKDLLTVMREKASQLSDLVREPFFVPEKTRLSGVLQLFIITHHHMALVVDEFGAFVGLITLEDVLEEIVGEIEDEHDEKTDQKVERISPREFRINPLISISDLSDETNVQLPNNGADTLGGYIIRHLGQMPRRGDSIELERCDIHITKVSTRRVLEVKMIVRADEA